MQTRKSHVSRIVYKFVSQILDFHWLLQFHCYYPLIVTSEINIQEISLALTVIVRDETFSLGMPEQYCFFQENCAFSFEFLKVI